MKQVLRRKTIHVITLGGTISMLPDTSGVTPQLSAIDLVEMLRAPPANLTVVPHEFCRLPGPSISFDDLFDLAKFVEELCLEPDAGIVIVQGTDTIEETAFGLELLIASSAPIIVTGAMRPPHHAGSDGVSNLNSAIKCAAHDYLQAGVYVTLNNEIHSARYVRKSSTSALGSFCSGEYGPIGLIDEGMVRTPFALNSRIPSIRMNIKPSLWPTIALLKLALCDDGMLANLVSANRFQGCVIEGMGAGHAPSIMRTAIQDLSQKMPVVLASRTGSGRCFQSTYAYDGSETDLLNMGLISAGQLPGPKARILLMLLAADNPKTVKKRFQDYCEII